MQGILEEMPSTELRGQVRMARSCCKHRVTHTLCVGPAATVCAAVKGELYQHEVPHTHVTNDTALQAPIRLLRASS